MQIKCKGFLIEIKEVSYPNQKRRKYNWTVTKNFKSIASNVYFDSIKEATKYAKKQVEWLLEDEINGYDFR